MELVYVTVIGAMLGVIVRFVLPHRHSYGLALLPAIAAATTSAVWVALLWSGWKFNGGWIWVVSLGSAIVVSILVAVIITRVRTSADAHQLHVLSGGKTQSA